MIPLEAGRYLVYAPLRRAAFLANVGTVRSLAVLEAGNGGEPSGSLVAFLQKLGFLDGPPEIQPVTTFTGEPAPVAVTLLLTTACNLRCSYCYASAGDGPVQSMTLETARRGIDFVAGNAASRGVPWFEVNYHGGGEPTMNWPVLTASLEYAREKAAATGLELRSSLATNGVLSDSHIDWIVSSLRGATVSYDGLPAVHDLHRVTRTGAASSHRVMHTMRRFDAAGFYYGIRLTLIAGQLATLPDSVEFICS
ncbi:MAG: radical SAM protein, partial [Acidobacteriota bacterium]